jgi:hypothetical protein
MNVLIWNEVFIPFTQGCMHAHCAKRLNKQPAPLRLADSNATKDPGWLVAGRWSTKELLTPSGGW